VKRILVVLAAVGLAMGACSDSGGGEAESGEYKPPSVVASVEDIDQMHGFADEFGGFWGSWPDNSEALSRFADDAVFWDPADGDYAIEGAARIVPILNGFTGYFANVEPIVNETFVSTDAAAYRTEIPDGYWPPWITEPEEHPPVVELDGFRFENRDVTNFDIWFSAETLGTFPFGCFAFDGCPQLDEIVRRYTTAWVSGDPKRIAELYADDAEFSDTLLGIDTTGSQDISGVADQRFGTGNFTLEVLEVFAQTDGPAAPTDAKPDIGEIIAVSIHYRIIPDSGGPQLDSLAMFELGTRHSTRFETHSLELITRENVLHQRDTLAQIAN